MNQFETLNANGLNRAGVLQESQQRRQAIAEQMRGNRYQFATLTVNRGPQAIAEQAAASAEANLAGLRQLVAFNQGLDQDPNSGWQMLRQLNIGSGNLRLNPILDALTAEIPSQPGERPRGAAAMFLTYRSIRSSVRGQPSIDRYNVNVGEVRRVTRALQTLQRGSNQQIGAALQSVIQQLQAYESMDPQMQVFADVARRRLSGGSTEGMRYAGRAITAIGSGLIGAIAWGVGLTSGTFNPLMAIAPGLTLYSLYPGILQGRMAQAAERSSAVVQSNMYQRLAPLLGPEMTQLLLTNMRGRSASNSAINVYIREVRAAARNRGQLRQESVANLVDMLLPQGQVPENLRAALGAAATEDPLGMVNLITHARRVRDPQSQELVQGVTESGNFRLPPQMQQTLGLTPVPPAEDLTPAA